MCNVSLSDRVVREWTGISCTSREVLRISFGFQLEQFLGMSGGAEEESRGWACVGYRYKWSFRHVDESETALYF